MNNNSRIEEKFLSDKKIIDHTTDAVNRAAGRTGLSESAPPAQKISSYLSYLDSVISHGLDRTRKTYQNDIKLLRNMFYEKYIIKKENIGQAYFDNKARIALENGHGYLEYDEQTKEKEINDVIASQRNSLNSWLEYFASKDSNIYPMWFKYYAFQGMVKIGNMVPETGKVTRRTSNTTHPFVELNREALAMVYGELSKYLNKEPITFPEMKQLLEGGNFGKIYALTLKKINSVNINKSNEGLWKKYEQGSDPEILFNDIYGKNTGWCTAGSIDTAKSQLDSGNFYVYYTKDNNGEFTIPRIAIRKENGQIAEIRGIEENQNIESNMEQVIYEKLKEPDFPDRDLYKKKVEDMQMMTYIYTKWKNKIELTAGDLKFLYELEEPIIGFGYEKDPRINEIISSRDIKEDLKKITGYSSEEISVGGNNYNGKVTKLYYGDILIEGEKQIKNFKFPEYVFGNIMMNHAEILTNVEFPEKIRGELYCSRIKEIVNVNFANLGMNSCYFNKTKKMKNVIFPKKVEYLDITSVSSVEEIIWPEEIDYLAIACVSNIETNLPKRVRTLNLGGVIHTASNMVWPEGLTNLTIELKTANGLELPESLEYLNLKISNVDNLVFPAHLKTLSLDIHDTNSLTLMLPPDLKCLEMSKLENFKGIKNIHELKKIETLILGITSTKGLNIPDSIRSLTLGKVKNIADFTLGPNVNSISLPSLETIEGLKLNDDMDSVLLGVKKINNFIFPKKITGTLELEALKSVKSLILPEEAGDIIMSNLTTFEGITWPKKITGFLELPPLKDVSSFKVPDTEEQKKQIIDALKANPFNPYLDVPEYNDFINKLEQHFKKANQHNKTTHKTPHLKTTKKEPPRGIRVTSTAFSNIKEKIKKTSNLAMEKFLLLKQKYVLTQDSQSKVNYNNDDNKTVDKTEKTTDETRKK